MTAPPPDPGQPPICSAKGCREPAVWALLWNNPKLHTAGRRKTWVACEAHRAHLEQFLDLRGFLRSVEPLTAPVEAPAASVEPLPGSDEAPAAPEASPEDNVRQ